MIEESLMSEINDAAAQGRDTLAPVPEIKQIRLNLKLTQKQFAKRLGVSVSTVESWEQGVRNVSKPTLALARTFKVRKV